MFTNNGTESRRNYAHTDIVRYGRSYIEEDWGGGMSFDGGILGSLGLLTPVIATSVAVASSLSSRIWTGAVSLRSGHHRYRRSNVAASSDLAWCERETDQFSGAWFELV